MASTRAARHRRIAMTVVFVFAFGRLSVAIIVAVLTTMSSASHPGAEFETFKTTCTADPAFYARGAIRGVYREHLVAGTEVDQTCSLYGSPRISSPGGVWLRDYTRRNCGPQDQVPSRASSPPESVATPIIGRPGASLGIPVVGPPVAPRQVAEVAR